ncbi:hypothetical protein [Methylocapsa palsarum]|uniref:Uncharacterized protein n=1 Tax=Methylocapsa palsarum TaxID=1612308 RepID=A0A1I3YPE0_9HYPH|nr:hypothetical protein [Methylocapsa palsarum]SFK33229.1 hypothetical protein SAMN05444581_10659 [Methylocapsa palsarum]
MTLTDPASAPRPLPNGYRQSIGNAITIFLGFSLTFLRGWVFEAPGDWTPRSVAAALVLTIPIFMEIHALFRSLRLADDDAAEYVKTVRWFIASVIAMVFAILLSAVILSGAIEPGVAPSPHSPRIER